MAPDPNGGVRRPRPVQCSGASSRWRAVSSCGLRLPPRSLTMPPSALRSTREPSMPPTFAALGVPAHLCARLDELGITEPFPVQAATLPDALAGRDVCGKAPTGSGKTIAFGLPLLARIEQGRAPPAQGPRARAHPRARLAGAGAAAGPVLGHQDRGARRLRRRRHGAADEGARQGRRDRRRHPRPPQGPPRPRLAAARRRQPRRHRRGRPHGRHGLPARGAAPARPDATRSARRCCSPPRSTATSTC